MGVAGMHRRQYWNGHEGRRTYRLTCKYHFHGTSCSTISYPPRFLLGSGASAPSSPSPCALRLPLPADFPALAREGERRLLSDGPRARDVRRFARELLRVAGEGPALDCSSCSFSPSDSSESLSAVAPTFR